MKVEKILSELIESEKDGSLLIFRKLITCREPPRCGVEQGEPEGQATWQPVLRSLLEILAKNRDYGNERILLISHAFLALLFYDYDITDNLKSYLQLDNNRLHSFDREYNIEDIDLFKLLISYGYLQVNKKEIYYGGQCALPFDVLYQNCTRYTKYTHLAYKVLHTWLQRASKSCLWERNAPDLERKLETIIYSNWDNSIKEVSKLNSTSIFNQYLRIMDEKYRGFIGFVFQDCVKNISWLNATKYVILTEICEVWNDVETITERQFISEIFTSLTRNYLRSSGTKLYNTILNKLSEKQWKRAFGDPIELVISRWEYGSEKNHQALHLLCTQWLEPAIRKHHSIWMFLWNMSTRVDIFFRSHLERIATDLDRGSVHTPIDHCDEDMRLNSFAAHCQEMCKSETCLKDKDLGNYFSVVKDFLIYNASSSSTHVRRGVIKYFQIFFSNLVRRCYLEEYYDEEVFKFFYWLHEFLVDCFEIGSCYQRKALGIKLYEMILFYTNEREMSTEVRDDPRFRMGLIYGFKLKTILQDFGEWRFTDKKTLLWLLKLILDPATDVREASVAIIVEHFQRSSLDESEKRVLLETAIAKCNSSKFYETESGAMLLKILSLWLPFKEITAIKDTKLASKQTYEVYDAFKHHTKYIEYLLHEADKQLVHIKQDILRASMQNSPFHGTLTAILNVGFRNEFKTELITAEFTDKLLALLKDAVDHFLSLLSSKSKNCEFSSSFAEMGLAIDETVKESKLSNEYDDIVLSPAHQVVITCIWISLKVSCELASEIGMLTYSQETVERSSDIIISVLTKCRHKGAIEAAGLAIGHLTRKLVNTKDYSKLPEEWLRSLTSGDDNNPNLTRRSAGLSIMFHRIVGNDNRNGRPFVHIAIRNLLDLLENNPDPGKFKNESYQDLPRAKHLHFLQRLVADSYLHAQVVPYLERITMECFKNLQSEIWTVRNASLQLFGAIVPRIAGQQNGGQTLDYGTGYSMDHFISHYPALADHIYSELAAAASWESGSDATLKIHSAIVPSIILLSRMSTGGSDLIDYSSEPYVHEVKQNLKLLFGSPIGNVRILAAKAYAALVLFPQIMSECMELREAVKHVDQLNYAHGYLCAIKYVGDKYRSENEISNRKFEHLFDKRSYTVEHFIDRSGKKSTCGYYKFHNLNNFLVQEFQENSTTRVQSLESFWHNLYSANAEFNSCYVVEALSLSVFRDTLKPSQIFLFKEIGDEKDRVLETQRSKPGFSECVDTLTRLYVDGLNRSDNIDKDIIGRILDSQCMDQSVTFVNNLNVEKPVQDIIFNYILNKFPSIEGALLDAMVHYLRKSMKNSSTPFQKMFGNEREIKSKVYQIIERISGDQKYWKLELFLYQVIHTHDFDSTALNAMISYCSANILDDDEVVREAVAECLPCLLLHLRKTDNDDKFKIIRLCLALLKDEVAEIRESAGISMNNFINCDLDTLGEILYYKIFDEIIISDGDSGSFSTVEILQFFLDYVASINIARDFKPTVESPFDHEEDATSAEETKLLNIIFHKILQLGGGTNLKNDSELGDIVCVDAVEAKNQIQNKAGLDFSDLKTILDLSYADYMVAKRYIVLESCNRILKTVLENQEQKSQEDLRIPS